MQGSFHHEVLLALSGYPGNIFRVSKEEGTIKVDPDLPFMHPSETVLLNRMCQLGTHYNRLRCFISEQNSSSFCLPSSSTTTTKTRLYLKALACGMDRVLHGYRKELIKLEEKCVREPHLPLSHLKAHLEQFYMLLPSLEECVNHLTPTSTSHGCQLLSYLHNQCSSGVPSVQQAFEQLLCMCHGVLYKQLSAWMLHGLLLGDKHEFFIEQQQKKEKMVLPGEEKLSSFLRREAVLDKEFIINHSMAPSYLPASVLEKIKFVGEAVTIFKDTEQSSDKVQCGTPPSTPAESRLRSDQLRFADMFAQLQRQPKFCLQEFEKVIDIIRNRVAELLWKLLVEESNLTEHLQVMKDFYLLGRGELFLAFIDLSHHFMSLPPTATTQHDVNLTFHQAMARVGVNGEKMAKQFELTVPYSKPKDRGREGKEDSSSVQVVGVGGSAWDQLSLCHTTHWPLHTLFTPPILHKYNTLFQMLLRLRRTQVSLHHCWALLMQHRRKHESLRQVWELRTYMGFLIDNLQYYVQVDVLETQFAHLLEQVSTTYDFETIQHAHEAFLITLQSQLFLNQPSISHCLQEVLTLCQQLSRLLQGSQELSLTFREQAEVNRIAKDFGRQSTLFFDIISRVKVHISAPHLAQLLLRVDYNKYYSNSRKNRQGSTAATH